MRNHAFEALQRALAESDDAILPRARDIPLQETPPSRVSVTVTMLLATIPRDAFRAHFKRLPAAPQEQGRNTNMRYYTISDIKLYV